jgi:hypothetical protein
MNILRRMSPGHLILSFGDITQPEKFPLTVLWGCIQTRMFENCSHMTKKVKKITEEVRRNYGDLFQQGAPPKSNPWCPRRRGGLTFLDDEQGSDPLKPRCEV